MQKYVSPQSAKLTGLVSKRVRSRFFIRLLPELGTELMAAIRLKAQLITYCPYGLR